MAGKGKHNETKPDPTISITLKFPIEVDSKLFELIQSSSRIGLQIMTLRNAGKKVSDGLKAIYEEADKKLKVALMDAFVLPQPIDNLSWDSEHFLSFAEHCIILAPEG